MNLLRKNLELYLWWANVRAAFFKPISFVLAKLHITPNVVTYAGTASMVCCVIFMKRDVKISLIFAAATYLMDLLDGALARYLNHLSDKGKFIDSFSDHINYLLLNVGFVYTGILNPMLGMLVLYLILMDTVLRAVYSSFYIKSDWHFKIFSGPLPGTIMHTCYLLFLIFALFTKNYFDICYAVFGAILAIDTVRFYIKIRKARVREKAH